MTIEDLYTYCLHKKGTESDFPFDETTLAFKVGGKIYALTSMSSWENQAPRINLKCNPEYALELRDNYEGIIPGYHMNKKHWNTINVNDLSNTLVLELIQHSYDLVFESLSKQVKQNIKDLE